MSDAGATGLERFLFSGTGWPYPPVPFIALAIVLPASYLAGLWFSLRTRRDVFSPHAGQEEIPEGAWSVRLGVALLAVAGVAVGSTWFEGVELLAVHVVLGIVFYFV